MDNTRLTKKIFLWDYSKCRINWSHEVKKVFVDIGNIVAFQSCSLVNLMSYMSPCIEKTYKEP